MMHSENKSVEPDLEDWHNLSSEDLRKSRERQLTQLGHGTGKSATLAMLNHIFNSKREQQQQLAQISDQLYELRELVEDGDFDVQDSLNEEIRQDLLRTRHQISKPDSDYISKPQTSMTSSVSATDYSDFRHFCGIAGVSCALLFFTFLLVLIDGSIATAAVAPFAVLMFISSAALTKTWYDLSHLS